jgi:uncharacterized membrane protein (DUF4010 family)
VALVAALKPSLLTLVAPALLAATAVAAGFAFVYVYWRGNEADNEPAVEFRNPFDLLSVIGFALLLAAIIVAGRALGEGAGATGAILGAAAMGFADVDAVTVAITRLVPQPLGVQGAAYAILAAVATNTLSKIAIGAMVGRGRFALAIALMSAGAVVAALLALWVAILILGPS